MLFGRLVLARRQFLVEPPAYLLDALFGRPQFGLQELRQRESALELFDRCIEVNLFTLKFVGNPLKFLVRVSERLLFRLWFHSTSVTCEDALPFPKRVWIV